jgi:predicted TIM-barrel fold metal-dependent hydrolase
LSRDPEFTAGFLERHRDKLMYGSDCPCLDGQGAGITGTRLPGKCLSRETLSILKKQASPAAFRKIVWENTHRVYKIKA